VGRSGSRLGGKEMKASSRGRAPQGRKRKSILLEGKKKEEKKRSSSKIT